MNGFQHDTDIFAARLRNLASDPKTIGTRCPRRQNKRTEQSPEPITPNSGTNQSHRCHEVALPTLTTLGREGPKIRSTNSAPSVASLDRLTLRRHRPGSIVLVPGYECEFGFGHPHHYFVVAAATPRLNVHGDGSAANLSDRGVEAYLIANRNWPMKDDPIYRNRPAAAPRSSASCRQVHLPHQRPTEYLRLSLSRPA